MDALDARAGAAEWGSIALSAIRSLELPENEDRQEWLADQAARAAVFAARKAHLLMARIEGRPPYAEAQA